MCAPCNEATLFWPRMAFFGVARIMLITGASLYLLNVRKDGPRRLTYVRAGWALILYSRVPRNCPRRDFARHCPAGTMSDKQVWQYLLDPTPTRYSCLSS